MNVVLRRLRSTWLLGLLAGIVCLVLSTIARVRHIEYVTALAGGEEIAIDATSRTGYTGGLRVLVPPQRDVHSLQWILQAQEMIARGDWHLRDVAYDNAPTGRPVWTSSPYRWWLATVGWVESRLSGNPWAVGIERAALWADPVLHGLLWLAVVAILWRIAGRAATVWASLATVGFHPLAATFLPGRPDETGMALVFAVLSVVPLVAGLMSSAGSRRWPWFLGGGLVGGLGLAVSTATQMPIVIGIALGGLILAWWERKPGSEQPITASSALARSWRLWSAAGAAMSVLSWLAEQTPAGLSWIPARTESNHLIYALAWLGLGECVATADGIARGGWRSHRFRHLLALGLSLSAMSALPVVLVRSGEAGFLATSAAMDRMTDLPGDSSVGNLGAWIAIRGLSIETVAALLPVFAGLAAAGCILAFARATRAAAAAVVVLVPLVLVIALASASPGAWAIATALSIVLIAPTVVAFHEVRMPKTLRTVVGAGALASIALGGWMLVPRSATGGGEDVSHDEVQALIERDLAWWIARHAPEPEAIVFAPPDFTVAAIYYGGLRGLGSPFRENEGGFRFSVRLAAASSPDEGEALAQSRNVRYVVIPSWDDFLEQYARLGANQPDKTIVALMRQWLPPRWLRPMPYLAPQVEGVAERSAVVFEVVDIQDNPTALSRLADYFLETGRLSQAVILAATLKEQFPTEPAAVVARAQIAWAKRDAGEVRETVQALLRMVEDGSTEVLSWDRRVNLALVLSSARYTDEARVEAQRCLDEMDATLLRTLTDRSLQQFITLIDSLHLEITDPELAQSAANLLRQLPPPR